MTKGNMMNFVGGSKGSFKRRFLQSRPARQGCELIGCRGSVWFDSLWKQEAGNVAEAQNKGVKHKNKFKVLELLEAASLVQTVL